MTPGRERKPTSTAEGESTATTPQSTPAPSLPVSGDYSSYVWQQLGEIQRTLGRVEAKIDGTADRVEKIEKRLTETDSKISRLSHTIYATAAVVTVLSVLAGFVFKEVWEIAKPLLVERIARP